MIAIKGPSDFDASAVPLDPGVYLYRDAAGEIIYIGKAKSLRSRVRSYFSHDDKPLKTRLLVSKIRSIDWVVVDSEIEALLLENKLIKKHAPKYNINLKDAKTFAYIALSDERYPKVYSTRQVRKGASYFGPYTDGAMRKELVRLTNQVFKLRTCKALPKRACLNFHIGLCTAPCIGNVSAQQYADQVESARRFLKGDVESTVASLKAQMLNASKAQHFERALELRNQISSMTILFDRQKVDQIKRFDQDIIAFRRLAEKLYVTMFSIKKGVMSGKKEFLFEYQEDVPEEFVKRYYTTTEPPYEVILNRAVWDSPSGKSALEAYLAAVRGAPVTLTVPEKGEKLSLIRLAEKNIESNLEENSVLVEIKDALNLPQTPSVIECFDISNLGREHIVAGMVRYVDGKPDRKGYRRFRMRTVEGKNDDFASMREVVGRRYARLQAEQAKLPHLIIIDGGQGQLQVAKEELARLGLQIPIIGLAKKQEEIYIPDEDTPLLFPKTGRMMLLIRQIRDEVHRFSITYNRKRREMRFKEDAKEASKANRQQ